MAEQKRCFRREVASVKAAKSVPLPINPVNPERQRVADENLVRIPYSQSQSVMFRKDVLFYAEDDAGFVDLLHCALAQGDFNHQVIHVPDGEQAMLYFKGEGKFSDRERFPLPGLALIDLKMPRVNGFDLIQWLRSEEAFKQLPIVVLTVSEELRDVNRAYQLGANSFLVKPPGVTDLREMLKLVDSYWLGLNVAPSHNVSLRR